MSIYQLKNRRAIIDRRAMNAVFAARAAALADDLPALRQEAVTMARDALAHGRRELAARALEAHESGRALTQGYSFLTDQVLGFLWEATRERLCPLHNPTDAERLAIAAVGGYGRAEMAPYSDVDLLFLTPYKQTSWGEQSIETLLYMLWDLNLKIGHATRSVAELMRMAKDDVTVRTAFLETRLLCGDADVFETAKAKFQNEIVKGSGADFVADKLAERDARHKRMGDSRYVVEPNVKEGKGGLRDLHTLYWIAKYIYQVEDVADLVGKGVLSAAELRTFRQSESFLWTVRCHLHLLAKRAEERLTFDVQPELARRLGYSDRPGMRGVERFMKHCFLTAKRVGNLTRIFCANLEEGQKKTPLLARLPGLKRRPRKLEGFILDGDRLSVPSDDFFRADPVRMIQIFQVADRAGVDLHPNAMRLLRRNRKLVDAAVRADPRANAYFMDILTSRHDPETALRRLNEAGVFGRFVPDFGRVEAQMQYDMYHHYTVDEHTIRAIGLLAQIEKGALAEDHPLSTAIMPKVLSRRVLYVAVLLHDIAKGRGGNHSVLGAEIAHQLCPRLGLSAAETETVAWLVLYHLLMSHTAFKRDLADFKTILDFAAQVKSPERLRLLLVLTVVDIRAVGPKAWNGWKGQLLRELYEAAAEVLVAGHAASGRSERVAAAKQRLRAQLPDWSDRAFNRYVKRLRDAYWIAESPEVALANAQQVAQAGKAGDDLSVATRVDAFQAATTVTVYTADHPGLFYRIAGAIALAGASIVDAKIHTTTDGMALDNITVQDEDGQAFDDPPRLQRLEKRVADVLQGRVKLREALDKKPAPSPRQDVFQVEPAVYIDNNASNRFTVIEVNGADRPALLYYLTRTLFDSKVTISSAHVATYGERAVDVFYVTDLLGHKITNANRLKALERRLLEALGAAPVQMPAPAASARAAAE